MRIAVFASGSGGNCLLLQSEGTNILLDAGISARRLSKKLDALSLSPREIDGVLITHEHSDHISGLKTWLKRIPCPVYAPPLVAAFIASLVPESRDWLIRIRPDVPFRIGGLTARAFSTPHDTPQSVGYRIEGDAVFAAATDMGHVTDEIAAGLLGADMVLIEANHDEEMLRTGPYPFYLKKRILSANGHLSNANCAAMAASLADSGTRTIVLGHLSAQNNLPSLAEKAVREALGERDVSLYCAPADGCLYLSTEETECWL